jgi:hypothetical protein
MAAILATHGKNHHCSARVAPDFQEHVHQISRLKNAQVRRLAATPSG